MNWRAERPIAIPEQHGEADLLIVDRDDDIHLAVTVEISSGDGLRGAGHWIVDP